MKIRLFGGNGLLVEQHARAEASGIELDANEGWGVTVTGGSFAYVKDATASGNGGGGFWANIHSTVHASLAVARDNIGRGFQCASSYMLAQYAVSDGNSYGFRIGRGATLIANGAEARNNTEGGFWADSFAFVEISDAVSCANLWNFLPLVDNSTFGTTTSVWYLGGGTVTDAPTCPP